MIFNIDKETMPREKIREIQLSRLQDLCRRVYANVPFYRRSFDEKGIKPSDVQSLDDLKFLPFTLKQDMRNNYPYGLFAVPMEMIQRIHASSGTTGKATVVGYTKRDIETWAECAARSLAAAGATANDIVVHIFQQDVRELFRIESLWKESPALYGEMPAVSPRHAEPAGDED